MRQFNLQVEINGEARKLKQQAEEINSISNATANAGNALQGRIKRKQRSRNAAIQHNNSTKQQHNKTI